jgi:glutaredoxin-related protein
VHKKKCPEIIVTKNSDDLNEKELIMMLVKQNSELLEVLKNGTHNTMINNHSNNKTFNLQFFLNETCKDAMNIMDFVDSIKLQLADLENFGEIGYVNGISNIIVKNLKQLDVTERPVHCTDKKREVLYIKDENKWEKEDSENNKMRKVIKKVANKNIRLLQKFKEEHPDCGKSESKYSDQYNKLIVEAMGGSGDNDIEKEDKIIKKIAKEVFVDK